VHHLLHLARRQEQVATAVVGQQEAEAVTVPGHLAGDQVDAADQHQSALAVLQDLAVALHRREPPSHRHDRVGPHVQVDGEFFRRRRRVLGGQRIEDRLPTRRLS